MKTLRMWFGVRPLVDADHAGDEITRRSRTGFIVYLNNAPVYWYSKRQGSVESSTYQAEFTAMREATEYIRALRYKLRMRQKLIWRVTQFIKSSVNIV